MTPWHASNVYRILGSILFGVALFVGVTGVRLFLDGRKNMTEALRLIDLKDRSAAVVALEDAAKAYVPGSPYPGDALRRLGILARGAEMRGELDEADHIWEVMRRSVLATRHFAQPNGDHLAVSVRELGRLRGQAKGPGTDTAGLLASPKDPDPWGAALLFIGLAAWCAGSAALCLGSRSTEKKAIRFRTYSWITCLAGLAIWLVTAYLIG